MEQETITDERRDSETRTQQRFDPTEHGLWARFKANGSIDHAAWVAAARSTPPEWVGTCPDCGGYLYPLLPVHINKDRIDYVAECRCGKCIVAPGGRLASARRPSRPRGL